jgi:hypothetical protein
LVRELLDVHTKFGSRSALAEVQLVGGELSNLGAQSGNSFAQHIAPMLSRWL